jgi:hypothetical protein
MNRHESGKLAGKTFGKQNGKRAVESGQLAKAWLLAPVRENGRIQGEKNRESGHMQKVQKIGASLGGKAASAANPNHIRQITTPDTRRMGALAQPIEDKIRGGRASTHLRWHVNRGRQFYNPKKCELCREELQNEAQSARPE